MVILLYEITALYYHYVITSSYMLLHHCIIDDLCCCWSMLGRCLVDVWSICRRLMVAWFVDLGALLDPSWLYRRSARLRQKCCWTFVGFRQTGSLNIFRLIGSSSQPDTTNRWKHDVLIWGHV